MASKVQLQRAAIRRRLEQPPGPDENRGYRIPLSEEISKGQYFAKDGGGLIYHYLSGVYRATGDEFIKSRVPQILRSWGQEQKWSPKLSSDVAEHIRIGSPTLVNPTPEILNCRNGLLEVASGKLLPHTPDHLSITQVPVSFNPEADCPEWRRFIGSTFPADATALGFEIAGWLMVPVTSIQKAVMLTGPGGNGKSVYLEALSQFLGPNNVSHLALQKLESDRFAASRLVGKLANICADLPATELKNTSVFKTLTGGDSITAERKFQDSFEFVPYARLIFSCNNPPRTDDSSEGFFRRWIVIRFARSFTPDKLGYIPRDVLDAQLRAPGEMSGLLNESLRALHRLLGNGRFTKAKSLDEAFSEFRAQTDPFCCWLDSATVDEPDGFVVMSDLRSAYLEDCQKSGRPSPTSAAVGSLVKRARPNLQDKQKLIDGRVQRVYLGLNWRRPAG